MSSPTSDGATPSAGGPARFGRYELLSLLGRGGMGEVHRALNTEDGRVVAVKRLPAALASDETYRERFRRESRLAAQLNEPHVIPIHHFGEIDGQLYLDMRLVDRGTNLATLLVDGPLPPDEAVDIVEQVAAALDDAHRAQLVHRDVKPSNVLVTKSGASGRWFAYLCDFGIARPISPVGPSLTEDGKVIGSWDYMAPERFVHGVELDGRADVYSLTCLFFETLTGERPFAGQDLASLVGAHLGAPRPRPSRAGLPARLDEVVARGMATDRADRYQSAGDLARAAREALTGTSNHRATRPSAEPPPDADGRTVVIRPPDDDPPGPAAPQRRLAHPPRPPTRRGAPPGPPPGNGRSAPDGPGPAPPRPRTAAWRRSRLTDLPAAVVGVAGGAVAWANVAADNAVAVPVGIGVAVVVYGFKLAADTFLGSRDADRKRGPAP